MKSYNFKITFENDDLSIIEMSDYLAEIETYLKGLDNNKRYDVAVIVKELKERK